MIAFTRDFDQVHLPPYLAFGKYDMLSNPQKLPNTLRSVHRTPFAPLNLPTNSQDGHPSKFPLPSGQAILVAKEMEKRYAPIFPPSIDYLKTCS